MSDALVISDLSFSYADKPVLNKLSLTINSGEAVAFIGPSGCGKSTFLKLLHSLLSPKSGALQINGKTALLFQDDRLLPWYTSIQNIMLGDNQKPPTKHLKHKTMQLLHLHEYPRSRQPSS